MKKIVLLVVVVAVCAPSFGTVLVYRLNAPFGAIEYNDANRTEMKLIKDCWNGIIVFDVNLNTPLRPVHVAQGDANSPTMILFGTKKMVARWTNMMGTNDSNHSGKNMIGGSGSNYSGTTMMSGSGPNYSGSNMMGGGDPNYSGTNMMGGGDPNYSGTTMMGGSGIHYSGTNMMGGSGPNYSGSNMMGGYDPNFSWINTTGQAGLMWMKTMGGNDPNSSVAIQSAESKVRDADFFNSVMAANTGKAYTKVSFVLNDEPNGALPLHAMVNVLGVNSLIGKDKISLPKQLNGTIAMNIGDETKAAAFLGGEGRAKVALDTSYTKMAADNNWNVATTVHEIKAAAKARQNYNDMGGTPIPIR